MASLLSFATSTKKPLPLPPPLSLFLTVDRPLSINFHSPQPSAAIKIKDGGHNIRYEITSHSLAKITPALQAMWNKLTFDNPNNCV